MQMRRSQVLLRMPVDHVVAQMISHDGEKSDVLLFIPPTEDIGRVLSQGAAFLPVVKAGAMCVLARDTIACIAIPELPVIPREDDLPVQTQAAIVTLRSGATVEGELRFTAPEGQQRTADFLNDSDPIFVVHGTATAFHVVKAHVAKVEEK